MASDIEFLRYVAQQMRAEQPVTFRAMFGGHTFYANGKVVALVVDNQLFVKATDAGKAYIGDYVEAPAYPGAKPALLITEGLDDSAWLSKLVTITEQALPKPKPKKKRTK
jgi:TfoX/Sxy family transcriptional regulator of competence genes